MPYKDPEVRKVYARQYAKTYETSPSRRAYKRRYYKQNVAQYADRYKKRRVYISAKRRITRLKRYGLTPEAYQVMHDKQKGFCAICCQLPIGEKSAGILQVDHNHITGKVRELLCCKCNGLLGMVNDSLELLDAAKDYLQRHADCSKH